MGEAEFICKRIVWDSEKLSFLTRSPSWESRAGMRILLAGLPCCQPLCPPAGTELAAPGSGSRSYPGVGTAQCWSFSYVSGQTPSLLTHIPCQAGFHSIVQRSCSGNLAGHLSCPYVLLSSSVLLSSACPSKLFMPPEGRHVFIYENIKNVLVLKHAKGCTNLDGGSSGLGVWGDAPCNPAKGLESSLLARITQGTCHLHTFNSLQSSTQVKHSGYRL